MNRLHTSWKGEPTRLYLEAFGVTLASTRVHMVRESSEEALGVLRQNILLSSLIGVTDPVFFLHHANLDRLWWIWQQTDPHRKHTVYNGKANSYTIKAASLTDILDIGGLLNSVPVSEVMETTSGTFCYQY